jgi:hypothetical protein
MVDLLEQAEQYRTSAVYLSGGHYMAGKRAAYRHVWLGVPAVVTAAVVSTAIFASLNDQPSAGWKIAAGLLSMAAVVLGALQTFFGFAERAERHKVAGAHYSRLRRRIDIFLLQYATSSAAPDRDAALQEFAEIAEKFADLALASPDLPDRFYNAAKRHEAATAGLAESPARRGGINDASDKPSSS